MPAWPIFNAGIPRCVNRGNAGCQGLEASISPPAANDDPSIFFIELNGFLEEFGCPYVALAKQGALTELEQRVRLLGKWSDTMQLRLAASSQSTTVRLSHVVQTGLSDGGAACRVSLDGAGCMSAE